MGFVDQVRYSVLAPKKSFVFHLENYKAPTEASYHTNCGISLYEHDWAGIARPKDPDIWEQVTDNELYNYPGGPLVFSLYTNDLSEIGNFTYTI